MAVLGGTSHCTPHCFPVVINKPGVGGGVDPTMLGFCTYYPRALELPPGRATSCVPPIPLPPANVADWALPVLAVSHFIP